MEPTTSKTGTKGAGQKTADEQSLSPQTNVNQATNRANTNPSTNRSSIQEAASFSGPADQAGQQQTGRGNSKGS
jgi:hypothetical protein